MAASMTVEILTIARSLKIAASGGRMISLPL
jgi:hypothetical protein